MVVNNDTYNIGGAPPETPPFERGYFQKDEGKPELGNCLYNKWPGIQRKVKDVNWKDG